jgi:hypothetical protein
VPTASNCRSYAPAPWPPACPDPRRADHLVGRFLRAVARLALPLVDGYPHPRCPLPRRQLPGSGGNHRVRCHAFLPGFSDGPSRQVSASARRLVFMNPTAADPMPSVGSKGEVFSTPEVGGCAELAHAHSPFPVRTRGVRPSHYSPVSTGTQVSPAAVIEYSPSRVHSVASAGRTRPALSLSLSRYELPRMFSVMA